MKRFIILLISLMLLTGCGEKKEVNDDNANSNDTFVLEKREEDKDYVYFEEFKTVTIGNNEKYDIKNIVLNIKSDDADNINLELKNFVVNSYNSMDIKNGYLNHGNVIDYEYYITEHFISIVQNYYFYMNGVDKEISSNVYVINKDTGKKMDNVAILDYFQYSDDKLFSYLEKNIESNDVMYSIMQIKMDGYQLFINNDNQMVIIYREVLDDGIVKHELEITD